MNVSRTAVIFVAAAIFASPAIASRLFGPSVLPDRTVKATAAEVMVRVATPDYALLPSLAAKTTDTMGTSKFTLDLFDDVEVTAEVVRTETTPSGGLAIIARLPELKYGNAVLVQNGNVLTGSVTFVGGTYSILPDAAGSVRIAKIAPQFLPPEGEPRYVQGAVPTAQDLAVVDPPADSGKRIDVIVFWTAAAQTAAGGLTQIQNNIDTAITLTNTAYRNSGIAQRLRLVNKQAVTYNEATADPFGDALNAITNGTITGTASARNTFGADEVVLVINNPTLCGLAWLPSTISSSNSGQGFAAVGGGTCLTTNFSFGHELGHNMGAHHDPYVNLQPGAFAYSHGMSHIGVSSGTSWRTIMAYDNECFDTIGSCTRLQYFSNPMVSYVDGFVMGDAGVRNNALTLNKSANAVSNYRATTVPITASFSDVSLADPQFGFIEFMYQAGFTNGCATGPLRYCPNNLVTRGEMAAFLERSKRGANFSRTPTGTVFTDVNVATPFAGVIEQLFADGITSGCGAGPTYCPTASVTRAQMAKFLLKARCGAAYTPATPASSPFSDVPVGDLFLPWIKKLYDLGITKGCSTAPLKYCPNDPVTRGTMAVFIHRTFPHITPSEACTP